jgi:hypothetical protein
MSLAFLVKFLKKKKILTLTFVFIFVLISAKSAERTPSQLLVNKIFGIFTERVKSVKNKMSDKIFDDTTVEIEPASLAQTTLKFMTR